MNGLVIVLISIVALGAGYLFYGRWLAKKWGLDEKAKTPAYQFEDGEDYVPSSKFTVFAHQFSSIAGAGPVTGPILASVFGWVPVLLWLIIGGLFFGAVQDFGSLYASVKNEGKSMGMIIEKYIGKAGRKLFMLFCWLFTLLVIAAFTDMVAGTFVGKGLEDSNVAYANSAAASISMLFILVAVVFGLIQKKVGKMNEVVKAVVAIALLVVMFAIGMHLPIYQTKNAWIGIIMVYLFLASVMPMWLLMQPRDYMTTFMLLGMIFGAVIGVLFAHPTMKLNAYNGFNIGGQGLFPTLFVTIACGAVSGFHSLVSSGTSSKTVSNEKDTPMIGYGAMIVESLLGVVALVVVGAVAVNGTKPDGTPFAIFSAGVAGFLEKLGVPILGTPAWSIDAAEDREKFDVILEKCGIPRPAGHTVMTEEEAVKAADELGYPVLVRPSYVLGGQGMEIAYKEADVREFMQVITRNKVENPVLVDKYMMGREIEVDAICDGDDILIPGIMEHFERAGVHSGDSISIYPSINIEKKHKDTLVRYTEALAKNLAVLGLVNIQFVLYNDQIYVIEVNPRSSRTVPYISKVTGVPMVDLATRCMFGEKLRDMGCGTGLHPESDHYAVKVPVFSFQKLRDLDTQLGPEMKSTGEVLGVAKSFREALLKGLTGAGFQMKKKGAVLISVRDSDKQEAIRIGERFEALGFDIYATSGTANVLNRHMVATNAIRNVDEPSPNIIDLIESGKIDYVVATSVKGRHPELGSVHIRRTAVERAIPCLTSMDTVSALLRCLEGDIKIENCEMIDINSI